MQFLVTGHDGRDANAGVRRSSARAAHLKNIEKFKNLGHLLYAAALLNDNHQMVGSMLILEFETRDRLDEWLCAEPYVTGQVWKTIEITPCRTADIFALKKS